MPDANEIILALSLVILTGPEKQRIEVNPEQVVSVRIPRNDDTQTYRSPAIKCLIHTTDGKFIAVVEDCMEVTRKLIEGRR